MSQLNCFTLRVRDLEDGIALTRNARGMPDLLLGTNTNPRLHQLRLTLGLRGSRIPEFKESRLTNARDGHLQGRSCIIARGDWEGVLVRVIAKELNFGLTPFAPNVRVWAGGEGLVPLARYGRMYEPKQRDELFALEEGQQMIVADTHNCLKGLACEEGMAVLKPFVLDEAVAWLVAHCTNNPWPEGVAWGVRTLDALGARCEADPFRARFTGQAGTRGRTGRARLRENQ